MFEKLKSAAEATKDVLLFVITPILFVAGYIWYLLSQNEELKARIERGERMQAVEKTVEEARKAEEVAKDAEGNYTRVRDQYKREHGDGGDKV